MIKPFDLHPMTEGQREYREGFLSSTEWRMMRLQAIDRDRGKCRICGCHGCLDVHHYSYEEDQLLNLDNLVTVCRTCHEVLTEAVKMARGIKYNLGEISPKRSADDAARSIGLRINAQNGDFVAAVLLDLYKASLQNGRAPINICCLQVVRPIAEIVIRTLDGQVDNYVSFAECNYKERLDALVRDYRARAYLHYAGQGHTTAEIQQFLGLNYAQMNKVRLYAKQVSGSG